MTSSLEQKLAELQERLETVELSQQNSTRALFDLILSVAQKEGTTPEKIIDILLSDEYCEYRKNFIKMLKEQAPELVP